MNKVKFMSAASLETLEESLNKFCEEHKVIATQFVVPREGKLVVAVWYQESKKEEVAEI